MKDLPARITPDRWTVQLFSARAAAEGGILRRSVVDSNGWLDANAFALKCADGDFAL